MGAEDLNAVGHRINKSLDAFDAKLSGSSNIRHWNVATGEWTEISVIEARKQQAERRAEKEKTDAKRRIAKFLANR